MHEEIATAFREHTNDAPAELRDEIRRLADAAEARAVISETKARREAFLEAWAMMEEHAAELGLVVTVQTTDGTIVNHGEMF